MKRSYLKTLLTLVLSAVWSFAASAYVSFDLRQPSNAIVGRPYQVTYVLKTDDGKVINSASNPSPSHPEINGMDLRYGPATESGMFSSYDSRSGSKTEYTLSLTYTYVPRSEGEATIPALSIKVGGTTYKTKPAKIKILSAGSSAQAQNSGAGRGQAASSQQVVGSSVGNTKAGDLKVLITFSRSSVYEMEPVVAIIKLAVKYNRQFEINGSTFNAAKLPEFNGFLTEDLPTVQRHEVEQIGGENYETVELRRYLIYPQQSGQLKVSSGQYDIDIVEYENVRYHSFVTRREVPRKVSTGTNTAVLNVKPLPEPRPANFSGAVGHFTISTELQPEIVRSNESATYSMIVKGSGNLKYLTAPEVQFPSTFEKYTAKTDFDVNFNGSTQQGSFRADIPFVAQEVGRFSIPAQDFVYFDPSAGKYVTLSTKAYDLNVLRGNAPVAGSQKQVETQMTDILHIKPLPARVDTVTSPVYGSWWYTSAYFVIALALIAVVLVYRRQARLNADVTGRRLARAGRVAAKRFKVASHYLKSHDSAHFYEELAQALRGYLGDKLSMQPSQLISETIAQKLTERGADQATVNEVLAVLDDCEMARFTPMDSDSEMNAIMNRATSAVKSIEDLK